MNKQLKKYLSSKALHSVFIRKMDGNILVSDTGRNYYIEGVTLCNADYQELKRSESYTEVMLKDAKRLINAIH